MKNIFYKKRLARARRNNVLASRSGRARLIVFKSNRALYAQVFDAKQGKVVCGSSTLKIGKLNAESVAKLGEEIAKKAINSGVKEVVFDKNGFFYQGNIKLLADSARKAGLSF